MSSPLQRFKSLSKRLKYSVYAALLLALYGIAGFLVFPWWATQYAPDLISELINDREVTIKKVAFNPFALSLSIEHFHIRHSEDSTNTALSNNSTSNASSPTKKKLLPFAGFDALTINFETKSLFTAVFTFDEFSLIKPYGHIHILQNGQLNFADLLVTESQPTEQQTSDNAEKNGLPQVLVHHFLIDSANFYFVDATKKTAFNADIGPLTIKLSDFSTEREKNSPYQLQAQSGGGVIGTNIEWQGFLSINPLSSSGQLRIDDVNLSKLASYFQDQINVDLKQGLLDFNGHYDFKYHDTGPELKIENSDILISDLQLGEKNNADALLSFPLININNTQFNLAENSLNISHIKISEADIALALNPSGQLNLLPLFTSETPEQSTDTVASKTNQPDKAPTEMDSTELEKTSQTASVETDGTTSRDTQKDFSFELAHFELDNNRVNFVDNSMNQAMTIDVSAINLAVRDISLKKNTAMSIALAAAIGQVEEKGQLNVSGEVIAFPEPTVSLNVKLEQQPLAMLTPYLQTFADVKLRSAFININTDVALTIPAESDPKVQLNGDISIDKLLLTENNARKKLIQMEQFALEKLAIDTKENLFTAQNLHLREPKLWIATDKKGLLNLQRVIKQPSDANNKASNDAASHKQKKQSITPSIKLDQLTITNAEMRYQDLNTEPMFSMALTKFGGQVKKLSSEPKTQSTLNLKGVFNGAAPLTVKGRLNVLSEQLYSDILVDIQHLNMTNFSSYSGTYAGREIDKGQLHLALDYKLANNHLIAGNTLLIDQLELGKSVESDEATKLPVGLAVSLLKNQQGEIHIDMPIEGDIDDPDFRYGKQLWKTFGNVLINAASSPFTLLAGLVDSDEDLSQITFEASSAVLSKAAINKIASLEQALLKRPELKLDIEACFNNTFDGPQFKLNTIQTRINPEGKTLSPERYRQRLSKDYQQQFNQQPKYPENINAGDKENQQAQQIVYLETQLIANEQNVDADLQALALERQRAIQTQLLRSNQLGAQRLFATAIAEKPLENDALHCHLSIQ